MAEEQETFEPEIGKEVKKEYEINVKNKKYILKKELNILPIMKINQKKIWCKTVYLHFLLKLIRLLIKKKKRKKEKNKNLKKTWTKNLKNNTNQLNNNNQNEIIK